MNIAKWLSALVGVVLSAMAGATTWDTSIGVGLTSGSIYCSTTSCQSGNASGLTGSVITMTAYSTPTLQTGGGTSPTENNGVNGNWLNAQIAIYGGSGVGITNSVQPASADANVPQHAIDNRGVDDVLVVDFGSAGWDVSTFSLGYICEMAATTNSSDVPTCLGTNSVNVDAWIGGSSAINFNTVSFSGNDAAATLPGFTPLVFTPDPGGSGLRTETTAATGRYLVITGSLAGFKDAFKITNVTAGQPGGPGGGTAPLPGTVWLFGLGLLAMTWTSRRRAATARC